MNNTNEQKITDAKKIFKPIDVDYVVHMLENTTMDFDHIYRIMRYLELNQSIDQSRIQMAKRVIPNDIVDYVVTALTTPNYDEDMKIMQSKGWDWENQIEPVFFFFMDRTGHFTH